MENSEVKVINRNLICVSGLKAVISTMQDECIFKTNFGTLKIVGLNLEILKIDLSNESVVVTGTFCGINYL